MTEGHRIAKNASWLVGAMSLNKLIAFGYFWAVAKLLGPQITGTYFFSVSVTSLFIVLSDLGITQVIILAYAGSRGNENRVLSAALKIKLALLPLAIGASLGYGWLKGANPETMTAISIACLVMAADTIHLMLYGALRGRQNLRFEAVGMLVGQIMTAIASISAAFLGLGAKGLVGGLLLGSVWNLLWAWRKTFAQNIKWERSSWLDVRHLAHEALPFAIAGLAVKTYSYLDTLFLEAFHGLTAVGIYSVAYKMTYALQFVPMTVTAAVYPAIAASWAKHDHEQIKRTYTGALRLMAFLGLGLAAGLSALAPRIVPLVYGAKYIDAVVPFTVLPWVLLALFMDFPLGSLLNATKRAHLKTTAMVLTMLMNIVLNILLVPPFGALGAAWASLLSFWSLFFFGIYFTRNDAGGWRNVLWVLFRAMLVAVFAWFVWRVIGSHLPFLIAFLLGTLAATAGSLLLGVITKKDLHFILDLRKRVVPQEEINDET